MSLKNRITYIVTFLSTNTALSIYAHSKPDEASQAISLSPSQRSLLSANIMQRGIVITPFIITLILIMILFLNIFICYYCFKKQSSSSASFKSAAHTLPIMIMLICGSCNDYLGKLIYQTLPQHSHISDIDYIITWILTTGSFFICSFALINGRKSFKQFTFTMFLKICIPSFLDVFVTFGRYLAIIFLPAAIVSILKNGLQLIFLAVIGRFYGKKKDMTFIQWVGFVIIMFGLIIASLEDIITNIIKHDTTHLREVLIGVCLLICVGFFGAIRNIMEEVLLINNDNPLNSDFLVGMESVISFLFLLIFAINYLVTDAVIIHIEGVGYHSDIGDITNYFVASTVFIVLFILFIMAIYGKDTLQMKVTKLTSSLTRKLFQQLYPIGTWMLSLITYYGYSSLYGEGWGTFSFLRIISFIVIISGTFLYIKPPQKPPKTPPKTPPKSDTDSEDEEIGEQRFQFML